MSNQNRMRRTSTNKNITQSLTLEFAWALRASMWHDPRVIMHRQPYEESDSLSIHTPTKIFIDLLSLDEGNIRQTFAASKDQFPVLRMRPGLYVVSGSGNF